MKASEICKALAARHEYFQESTCQIYLRLSAQVVYQELGKYTFRQAPLAEKLGKNKRQSRKTHNPRYLMAITTPDNKIAEMSKNVDR